mgnify:CR=1 FL=1
MILKFRAYHKEEKRMVDSIQSIKTILGKELDGLNKDYIIMCYTGRKDKNGNDAYELDILETPVGLAIIRFGELSTEWNKHIGFYVDFFDSKNRRTLRKDIGFWLTDSSIIGNVCANSELLKDYDHDNNTKDFCRVGDIVEKPWGRRG